MDVLNRLTRCASLMGNGENVDRKSVRLGLCLVIGAMEILNVICFLVDQWDDLFKRIVCLKVLIFLCNNLSHTVTLFVNWGEILPMLHMFHEMKINHPYEVSPRRKELFGLMEARMRRINQWWSSMLVAYLTAYMSAPLTIVAVKSLFLGVDFQTIIKDPIDAPFPIYYPQFIKQFENEETANVVFYFSAYTVHIILAWFIGGSCLMAYVTTLCAIVNVEYELKFMALSLIEMDEIYEHDLDKQMENEKLRKFCEYIIRHHQQIYRKFDVVNRGVRWIAFTYCFFNSLYTCLSIYVISKRYPIMMKWQELLFASVWNFGMYLYDVSGERTKTENDNLRNAIYGCSWLDKPEWFKKTMLIITARTMRPFDIKPFGLFGFSLNSFGTRVNAIYCYYNFLCNIK